MCSNSNCNLFFIYCESVAKKKYVRKQSNTTAVSTGVANIVSESEHFTSPSIFSSFRTAEGNFEWKYNDSYLSLGVYVYR